MDVSAIVTRLQAEGASFAQVIEASQSGNPPMQASQAALYSLLSGIVGGRMYPVQADEQGTYPEIVYQLTGSTTDNVAGYEVTRSDSYALVVMSKDYDELLTLQAQMFAACAGQNIRIDDVAHDFFERDDLYTLNVVLTYTFLASSNQATPAAFVYPISRGAEESSFDNLVRQRVTADYGVVVVTDQGNLSTLLNEVQTALLGWQQSASHLEMEYASGGAIESTGGLAVWREVYRDAYFITQT